MVDRKLIYAEDFISSLRDDPLINGANFKRVVQHINDAPAVDAVVHSFWDDSGRYQFASGRKAICCDNCKCALSVGEYNRFKWNYCPVCGAKMDGGNEDG